MEVAPADRETRLRRDKSARAVTLALEGNWEEAVEVNRQLLAIYPEDVEALNRLGKAYLELGRYDEAREAFAGALDLSPYNTIAKKNLERLSHLQGKVAPPATSRKVAPNLFIEESCKSGVTILQRPAPRPVLAKVAAGDLVSLRCEECRLVVEDSHGEYLGEVEPKLAVRLLRLIKGGNEYAGAVVSIHHQEVAVTLREVYTHPSLAGVCSFPARGSEEQMAYLRNAYLRLDLEAEPEEDDLVAEWVDGDNSEGDEMARPERVIMEIDSEDDEEEE